MISITSKQVFALRGEPRIHQLPFDEIQEWLNGVNPMSPAVKKHDSGKNREVFPDLSPAGPSEIPENPDERTSHTNVGSGYDKGLDPGGRADDETGPGNMNMPDPEQTFMDHSNSELAFLNEGDFSSQWNPMNYGSKARDRKSTDHLMKLHQRPRIRPNSFQSNGWKRLYGTV